MRTALSRNTVQVCEKERMSGIEMIDAHMISNTSKFKPRCCLQRRCGGTKSIVERDSESYSENMGNARCLIMISLNLKLTRDRYRTCGLMMSTMELAAIVPEYI